MTDVTLTAIEQGLQQPFAPEIVQYLPKAPKQRASGEWVCLALPYADKRAYEDRLNDLAFGEWSTPYNPPYAVGNKLVIPVTVTICGVEHTDYGEAFLTSTARNGDQSGAENSATEAYSQGFRRACAQFRLGRYFYALPKLWVSYDPARKAIALTAEQKYQLTLRLYTHAGLRPSSSHAVASSATPVGAIVAPASIVPGSVIAGPMVTQQEPHGSPANSSATIARTAVAPVDPEASVAPVAPVVPTAGTVPHFTMQEQKRRWLEQQLKQNAGRIQRMCEQYQVQSLDQLSEAQFVHLANRIFAAQQRALVKSHATDSPSSPSRRTHVTPHSAHDATNVSGNVAVKGR
jgi:Uncharacterized protein conserved in bacteria